MKRLGLALLVVACSGPPTDVEDSGMPIPDSGRPVVDSGTPDAGTPDGGFAASPHRAFPVFPKGQGVALNPLTLVTLVASNDPNAQAYADFSDALIASQWYPAVSSEYGGGEVAASLHATISAVTQDLVEQQIVDAISAAIADGGAPQPNGNTLYLVYLPAPYAISGAAFCAYHKTWFEDGGVSLGDGWGVVGQCHAFKGGEDAVEANTRVGSHEVIEAVTDSYKGYNLGVTPAMPWTKNIWSAFEVTGHVEVGDLCEGTRIIEGGWEYQRSWSNLHAAAGDDPCLPANPGGYYNVSAASDWYAADAGSTLVIPFKGWSTVSRGPWLMESYFINASASMYNFATASVFWQVDTTRGATKLGTTCLPYPGIGNGEDGTLTINVPGGAHSGDWISFALESFEEDPTTCYPFLDRDDYHYWPVGVYVP